MFLRRCLRTVLKLELSAIPCRSLARLSRDFPVAGENCHQLLSTSSRRSIACPQLSLRIESSSLSISSRELISPCRRRCLVPSCGSLPSSLDEPPDDSSPRQQRPPTPRRTLPPRLHSRFQVSNRKLQRDCRESLLLLGLPLVVQPKELEMRWAGSVAGLDD
jgi:hypothetical protein